MQAQAGNLANWDYAVARRRGALFQRFGVAVAAMLVFGPILGWSVISVWAAVYISVQFFEYFVFLPMNRPNPQPMGPVRRFLGGAAVFMNAASFSALAAPLWVLGGWTGGVCAVIMVAAGSVYALVNSPRSLKMLLLSFGPQFGALAVTPFMMALNGAPSTHVTAATAAVVVFGVYCLSTWQRLNRASSAEDQARIDAVAGRLEAERLMSSRNEYLAAVGHDLRTPIGAILTGAQEISRSGAGSQVQSQTELIADAGLLMKALLDDFLDHAKIEAGRMRVEATDFNLRILIAQTMRLWQTAVRAKGLKLRLEGARSVPAMVRGDPIRLRQILNNLLSNAVKFTDRGVVTLRIDAWWDEPCGYAVLMEVSDTGQGMSSDQLLRLFKPFDQTRDGVSARHGGSGLGLSISRNLAELMGGRLTARSRPGEGARFTLSVHLAASIGDKPSDLVVSRDYDRSVLARVTPLSAGLEPVVSKAASESASLVQAVTPIGASDEPLPERASSVAQSASLRVLIVDDHEINRRAIQMIISPLDCEVMMAANGEAALELCQFHPFDVIFMDVRMPRLDGRETTRRLRAALGPNAETPVVAVTADATPADIEACVEAGMTDFVAKPLTPGVLLETMSRVLMGEAETQSRAVNA